MFFRTIFAGFLAAAAVPLLDARDVTFSRDVAPILYKHCVSCHHPNDIAPMSLISYKETKPWAAAIREAVVTRKMPPWMADPHFGKWSNDASLTKEEIETIKAWAEGGKLEAIPKTCRPLPRFQAIGKSANRIRYLPYRNLSSKVAGRMNTPISTSQPISSRTDG